jgi:hypothetical protein
MLLLPESVDDYVGADNPVRFINAFVDELDLAAAAFRRVEPKATGRPGYTPGDLLKLYIYGYLNRVRSSRLRFIATRPSAPSVMVYSRRRLSWRWRAVCCRRTRKGVQFELTNRVDKLREK